MLMEGMAVLRGPLGQHWGQDAAREAVDDWDTSDAKVCSLRLDGHSAHWLFEVVWVIVRLIYWCLWFLESFEETLTHLLHVCLRGVWPYYVVVCESLYEFF